MLAAKPESVNEIEVEGVKVRNKQAKGCAGRNCAGRITSACTSSLQDRINRPVIPADRSMSIIMVILISVMTTSMVTRIRTLR